MQIVQTSNNNSNNNLICIAPVCAEKTSVALERLQWRWCLKNTCNIKMSHLEAANTDNKYIAVRVKKR